MIEMPAIQRWLRARGAKPEVLGPPAGASSVAEPSVEEPLPLEAPAPRTCPKDGTTMAAALGYLRSAGIWRCPTCGSVFVEPELMQWGRAALFARVVGMALVGLLVMLVLRRLRGRPPSRE